MTSVQMSSSARRKRVVEWTVDDVCDFLSAAKLTPHVEPFRTEGVDGSMLLECVQEEGALQELGVSMALERARLKSHLNKQLAEFVADTHELYCFNGGGTATGLQQHQQPSQQQQHQMQQLLQQLQPALAASQTAADVAGQIVEGPCYEQQGTSPASPMRSAPDGGAAATSARVQPQAHEQALDAQACRPRENTPEVACMPLQLPPTRAATAAHVDAMLVDGGAPRSGAAAVIPATSADKDAVMALSADAPSNGGAAKCRRRRGGRKGKDKRLQQAVQGCEASAASRAPVPLTAGSVSPTDGASIQTRAGLANPAEPAGIRARAPSSASTPQSAPIPAAATKGRYRVPPLTPDHRLPAADRHHRDVWAALVPYDSWLHGATLCDEDGPDSNTLGPHPEEPQESPQEVYYPGGDCYPPERSNSASLVSWLLTRYNPAGVTPDTPVALCIDARLPAVVQLDKFRYFGWPNGPPTAMDLQTLLLGRCRASAEFYKIEERIAASWFTEKAKEDWHHARTCTHDEVDLASDAGGSDGGGADAWAHTT